MVRGRSRRPSQERSRRPSGGPAGTRLRGVLAAVLVPLLLVVATAVLVRLRDSAPVDAAPGTALAAVEELEVKGRAPRTGYSREEFGDGWLDPDGNGCDTRNDVLRRDLQEVRTRASDRCVVQRGVLQDPYSGREIPFQRGRGTSDDVQIDHVVALADAWQKGAQQWSDERREQFANDPLELVAVDGALNQQKGAGDAATWLPPRNRCAYVARQVAVKVRYGLWVTEAERDAMVDVLSQCPEQPLPR